jgi:hypothetical protein
VRKYELNGNTETYVSFLVGWEFRGPLDRKSGVLRPLAMA